MDRESKLHEEQARLRRDLETIRCKQCGFRIRGAHHSEGKHHKMKRES